MRLQMRAVAKARSRTLRREVLARLSLKVLLLAIPAAITPAIAPATAGVLAGASLVPNDRPGVVVPVMEKKPTCIIIEGNEFCLVKKKHHGAGGGQLQHEPTEGAGPGGTAPQQGNTDTKTETEPGERSCPVGYVVLDKPNKCGSFCQPLEGDPCATTETAPATPATPATAPTFYRCLVQATPIGGVDHTEIASTEAEAQSMLAQELKDKNWVATGAATCTLIPPQ